MTTLPSELGSRELAFRPRLGDPAEVLRLISLDGALQHGHYRLLSGLHTDVFLAFSALAADSRNLELVTTWLGPTVDAWRADVVVAPSTAGVGLAATLARRISAPLHLASIGADGRPCDLLGSMLAPGSRVLLVNDVTTTGTAIEALADIVHASGAAVAGAAWFASRSLTTGDDFAFPTAHVADIDLPACQANECLQCKADVVNMQDALDLN